ncbi:MAG: shikimate dehydrogenase [Candidatus Aureabacteria bacterium]|nr:shikimate dehydrogenase [Candidatus Auribacterota bacterium]
MKKVFLIGHPLGHSASEVFQNAGFRALDMSVSYENCDIERSQLLSTVSEIKASDDYLGFNVTIPYKTDIIRLLDNVDSDPYAKITGAVNTVVRKASGELWGYNTDVIGFCEAVEKKLGFDFTGKKVLVIGAGGAGRAVVASMAGKVAGVVIADIDLSRADRIVCEAKKGMPRANLTSKNAGDIDEEIRQADLVVNATPLGMGKDTRTPINTDLLREGQYLFDVVYNPIETILLKKAKERGVLCSNGLSMLFYQGWHAFRLWIEEYNKRSGKKLYPDDKVHNKMVEALKKHFGVDEL